MDKGDLQRRCGKRQDPAFQRFFVGLLLGGHDQSYAPFGRIDLEVLPDGRNLFPKLFIGFFQEILVSIDLQISQKRISGPEREIFSALFFVDIQKMDIGRVKIHFLIVSPGFIHGFSEKREESGIASFLAEIQIVDGGGSVKI